jgi:hypothetical protein
LKFLIFKKVSDLRFLIFRKGSDFRFLIFRKGSCSEPWAWGREEAVQKERGITIELT